MEARVEKRTRPRKNLIRQKPIKVHWLRLDEKMQPIPWTGRPTGTFVGAGWPATPSPKTELQIMTWRRWAHRVNLNHYCLIPTFGVFQLDVVLPRLLTPKREPILKYRTKSRITLLPELELDPYCNPFC